MMKRKMVGRKTKKVCNQPDSKVSHYRQRVVIFLDAVRPGFGERAGATRDDLKHEQKYILMKDMFTRYVVHDLIIEIIMNPGEQQAAFMRCLRHHIDRYGPGDHITIVYHGARTGMFSNDYKWYVCHHKTNSTQSDVLTRLGSSVAMAHVPLTLTKSSKPSATHTRTAW